MAVDKLFLGLFRLLLQPLQSHFVIAKIHSLLAFELIGEPVDNAHVKIFTTEKGIAIGGLDFKNTVADLENGNVKSAATEIENSDFLFALFVEPIGQGRGGRLVDNPLDVQTRRSCRHPWWPDAGHH
jgi:hypothetical protein